MTVMVSNDENSNYREKYEKLKKSIINLSTCLIVNPDVDPEIALHQISNLIDTVLDESMAQGKEITRLKKELEEVKA